MANFIYESIDILVSDVNSPSYYTEASKIRTILEDAESPITRKFQEKMYRAILDKAHIDFDDIPKSKGNIRNYSGYPTMIETLDTMEALAKESKKSDDVLEYVGIVKKAIDNIGQLSATYEKGFTTKTEYVALEYDTYVFFIVEATTALVYSFVDVMKDPNKQLYDIKIKNTKLRADEFYFTQLKKFNKVQDSMGIDYRKMLERMCNDKDNFIGATAVGVGAVIAVALAIIPITRAIIYQIYNIRVKLSDALELQATFLDLNKACLENNNVMTADKRKKIITKQEHVAKTLKKLADSIKLKSNKSIVDGERELKKDNGKFSIDDIQNEISDSPLEIF